MIMMSYEDFRNVSSNVDPNSLVDRNYYRINGTAEGIKNMVTHIQYAPQNVAGFIFLSLIFLL